MNDRLTLETTIAGRKVILSERDSGDVYDLYDFEQTHKEDLNLSAFSQTQIIIKSMLPYYRSLKWYKPKDLIKKILLRSMMRAKWLQRNLSVSERIRLYTDILKMETEGIKKKVLAMAEDPESAGE